jgi:hypothetical protein
LQRSSAPSSDTALVRLRGDRRNEKRDFLRVERIADVERAHAGVEIRHEQDARRNRFGVMFSLVECVPNRPPREAEVARSPPARPRRHADHLVLERRVDDAHQLPRLDALVRVRLADGDDEIACALRGRAAV